MMCRRVNLLGPVNRDQDRPIGLGLSSAQAKIVIAGQGLFALSAHSYYFHELEYSSAREGACRPIAKMETSTRWMALLVRLIRRKTMHRGKASQTRPHWGLADF